MNYIINPWWFYLIGILDSIDVLSIVTFSIFVVSFGYMFYLKHFSYDEVDIEDKTWKRFYRISMVGAFVSMFLLIAIPDKQEMEKMLMASYVTEDNVNAATNYGKDLVDYIFEKVNEDE